MEDILKVRAEIIKHYETYGYEKQHYLLELLAKAFNFKEEEVIAEYKK